MTLDDVKKMDREFLKPEKLGFCFCFAGDRMTIPGGTEVIA